MMTNDEFNRWTAKLMGWELCLVQITTPYAKDHWREDGMFRRNVTDWRPATDLNDMRLVENRVIEIVNERCYVWAMLAGEEWTFYATNSLWIKYPKRAFQYWELRKIANADVEHRKASILAMREEIEYILENPDCQE